MSKPMVKVTDFKKAPSLLKNSHYKNNKMPLTMVLQQTYSEDGQRDCYCLVKNVLNEVEAWQKLLSDRAMVIKLAERFIDPDDDPEDETKRQELIAQKYDQGLFEELFDMAYSRVEWVRYNDLPVVGELN